MRKLNEKVWFGAAASVAAGVFVAACSSSSPPPAGTIPPAGGSGAPNNNAGTGGSMNVAGMNGGAGDMSGAGMTNGGAGGSAAGAGGDLLPAGSACTDNAQCISNRCVTETGTCRECAAFEPNECPTGCVDFAADPENCGACGMACDANAACAASACTTAPTEFVAPPAANCMGATVAIHMGTLYWTDTGNGSIRTATADGTASDLATGVGTPTFIAVDASGIYFVDSTAKTVNMLPLAGGTPTLLATAFEAPYALVLTATDVIYGDGKDPAEVAAGAAADPPIVEIPGNVMSVPKAGGTAVVVGRPASGGLPKAVATDGTAVVWGAEGPFNVEIITLGGADPQCTEEPETSPCIKLGASQGSLQVGASTVALDATRAYWIDGSNVKASPRGMAGNTAVGASTSFEGFISAFALAGTHVYWANSGLIERALLDTEGTEVVARNQGAVTSMVADATAIYYTTDTCQIMKFAL